MGNTPSQLEQQSANQAANLEKQVASLTANIDRLVTSLSTTQTQIQEAHSTIQDMKNPQPVTSENEVPTQDDPIIANFEKELTREEREVFIRKVIKHLTGNFDGIVENKDNQFGKSIAEIVHKIGLILSNPKSLPYNYVI